MPSQKKKPSKVKGVKIFRGDVPCKDCGTKKNIIWFTENVYWNNTVDRNKENPILCIFCFVKRFETKYKVIGWRITPEFPWVYKSKII